MKNLPFLSVLCLILLTVCLAGCTADEPEPVYPQPATLNEEGNYLITRFETLYTDYQGDTIGTPKSENPYPNHTFNLAGPSHYQEEINGTTKTKTTGAYILNAYGKTIKLTIDQPLTIAAGTYQLDSLTDKRMVMHLVTENVTTKVTKTFTVRANRQ